jgi:choline kinase
LVRPTLIILAAGMGTRLGRPFPKPLTPLRDGRSILEHQIANLTAVFPRSDVHLVVGFKKELVMEAFPDAVFLYNPYYDQTNTSKSLLRALRHAGSDGAIWMNGDVVFDPRILEELKPPIAEGRSVVCVNTERVGEEEIKYTLDEQGLIRGLSKTVEGGLGEAVGINYVAGRDRQVLIDNLEACQDHDYFERAIEIGIAKDGLQVHPLDISEYACLEVDFQADLDRANAVF